MVMFVLFQLGLGCSVTAALGFLSIFTQVMRYGGLGYTSSLDSPRSDETKRNGTNEIMIVHYIISQTVKNALRVKMT